MKFSIALLGFLLLSGPAFAVRAWTLEEAAAPYRGTTVEVVFLLRPGYDAIEAMIPEFEARTGINVSVTRMPYEAALPSQIRDFVSQGDLDLALIDLVWLGTFADGDWLVPIDRFTSDPALADPDLDLDDFFPLVLEAFGAWNGVQYGLPFDNYSGLLFYNRCMLEEAGFDRPPASWQDLRDVYGPALTGDGQYAFVLQSYQNETQSADSFARFLWPFGGSFLDADFRSNLSSRNSLDGLRFRQSLLPYMPPDVTRYDHAEAVNALILGEVAMITEWSAFYRTLADSPQGACIEIAPEPVGPSGRRPALGGFSMAVASQASPDEQAAAWLFMQWATSREVAREYLERGGVPARQSVYQEEAVAETFPFVTALVESWREGVPEFRPRFSEWTLISPLVQLWGTRMLNGEVSPEEGAQRLGAEIEAVLERAGYYDGRKPLAQ